MTAVATARQLSAQTRRLALLRWLSGLFLCSCLAQADPPATTEPFSFRAGESFAFLGDEITSEGSFAQYVENFFILRYPERPANFTNAGCASDTVADALERLQPDVIEHGADYVFVLLGTWDTGLAPYSEARLRAFQANCGELLDRLSRARIRPFLISPPMFDDLVREHRLQDETFRFRDRAIPPDANGRVALYAAWLREEAERRGIPFIDAWGPLNAFTVEERKTNAYFSLVPDSLQPDEGGHALIAAAIVESLALARESLGKLTLAHTAENPAWKVQARDGGAVSQLEGNQERVAFRWLPDSLPWAFPDAAMIAVQMAKMEDRFNRETFQLIGLTPGTYELIIGGERMTKTYSHLDLAKGVELQLIPERPDQGQAYRVACANQERYAEVIRPLGELRQILKRTRVNFPADDARYLKTSAELYPREQALTQEAGERLRTLYQQAKPVARAYEFRRVAEAPTNGTRSSNRRHR